MSAPANADTAAPSSTKVDEAPSTTNDQQQQNPITQQALIDTSMTEPVKKAEPAPAQEVREVTAGDVSVAETKDIEMKTDDNDIENGNTNGAGTIKKEERHLNNGTAVAMKKEDASVKNESPVEESSIDEAMKDAEPSTPSSSQPPTRSAEPSPAPASSKTSESEQREQPYSTRGRHASRETDADVVSERLGHLEEEEAAATVAPTGKSSKNETTVSFLDSLGEEERRTRTRFLPDVDGIHILYKAEIKQDLQLARTVVSSAGVSSTLTASSRRNNRRGGSSNSSSKRTGEEDPTDMAEEDDDGTPSPAEDDGMSADSVKISGYTAMDNAAAVPSRAFVAPSPENGEASEDGSKTNVVSSPHVVESVTAFNPPRPPESVGPKKKHRLVRWERRPQDVEVDLNSYRKTVYRTRSELENAQGERERIEAVSAHLRAHFLCQAQALNEEGALLNEELGAVQLECVKAADLLQSRTRSRGVGKGSYVMKDVLTILKQKGAEIANLPVTYNGVTEGELTSGIGGISSKAFLDWERGNKVEHAKPASGWILPGNTVNTPYGKGIAMKVFGPTDLDVDATPVEGSVMKSAAKPSATTRRHGFGGADPNDAKILMNGSAMPDMKGTDIRDADKGSRKNKNSRDADKHSSKLDQILAPRVCVKLPFGVGFFPLTAVTAQEDVSSYSDSMLASRWQNMTESAISVAGCVDHAAMANVITGEAKKDDSDDMDGDDGSDQEGGKNGKDTVKSTSTSFLPYGSGMFPTAAGRASSLHEIPLIGLEGELNRQLLGNDGVLGVKGNTGVPEKFRAWEDIRDELSVLRAQVLQRRNELARQRRLRALNERAFATTRDKSLRVEHLVSEMRADLKSLKDRLDYELIELGIDGEKADCLLSAHYKEEDSKTDFATSTTNTASPPKRQRREKEKLSPKQTRQPRRRLEGASTDDDFDESRPSAKRARPNQ